jgi:hypothetical protein
MMGRRARKLIKLSGNKRAQCFASGLVCFCSIDHQFKWSPIRSGMKITKHTHTLNATDATTRRTRETSPPITARSTPVVGRYALGAGRLTGDDKRKHAGDD